MTITLTSYAEAREALRSQDLRQALYDEGRAIMDGVIVNLHGDDHVTRRRVENRLFRWDTFAWYEAERIPRIVTDELARPLIEGRCDLLPLARRAMMTLSVDVAGVDRPSASGEYEDLFSLMGDMAKAAVVAHATGDKAGIVAAGQRALERFERRFYRTSMERRRMLIDEVERGHRSSADLPRDVLTTLLRHRDDLDLDPEVLLREVAYYPWVGAHSTANQFVHAMHHLFDWISARPESRVELVEDHALRQRFVHESMRLHPASPTAVRRVERDVRLRSGRLLPEGELVIIDMDAANRDAEMVGVEPGRFDPYRTRAVGVPGWALSFGTGTHSCLGQALAGGLEPASGPRDHLLGSVTVMAGTVLGAGARPDPDNPPTIDPGTTRTVWGRYPVLLDAR